jgi:hypothetical protein
MTTTIVFLVLLCSHLVGDWVAQSDWQATNKTRSWAALAAHVARYHLNMGLLLGFRSCATAGRSGRRWSLACRGPATPLSTGADRGRALLCGGRQQWFATLEWGVIAVDQALHLSILAMLAVLG